MSQEIATREETMIAELRKSDAMRAYIRTGDLSTLPEPEQDKILIKMCAHYGLDPILRPFCMIPVNGKKIWYATKSATDMVAARDKLSRRFKSRTVDRELMICEIIMEITDGVRFEEGTAVTSIGEFARDPKSGAVVQRPLTGEALANAIMKCETKAKRRATLAWFGMPDGSGGEEIENIAMAQVKPEAVPVITAPPGVVAVAGAVVDATFEAGELPVEAPKAKRGRPSRAEIEAKSMAETSAPVPAATPEPIHFAEQVQAAEILAPKPAPVSPPQMIIAKDASGLPTGVPNPYWANQKSNNPEFNPAFDPATSGRIVGEPEIEFLARTKSATQSIGQAVAAQLITENSVSKIKNLVLYSREVDSHKAFMKTTLEQCGIDWKKPEHIKMATKVSIAANGVAPIQDGPSFLAAEFNAWVSAELKKLMAPAVEEQEIPL